MWGDVSQVKSGTGAATWHASANSLVSTLEDAIPKLPQGT